MSNIAVVTDTNSGITQAEAEELGIYLIKMPFIIDEEVYLEGEDLDHNMFYDKLLSGADIKTSQPSPESVLQKWDELLKTYDSIIHIPMSSGLSGSCSSAYALALDYDGRIKVVDNKRISGTQKQSVLDAVALVKAGKSADEIAQILIDDWNNATIYLMVDTLKYLKKGGRITPTAAALGTLLKIKPILTIQGDKLDAFQKARTTKIAKEAMLHAIQNDVLNKFGYDKVDDRVIIGVVHSNVQEAADIFIEEIKAYFPECRDVKQEGLSLSIATHVGNGVLAVYAIKKLAIEE